MGDMLTMSENEIDRILICEKLARRLISHSEAAEELKLSKRQTKRLLKRFRVEGKQGLLSKSRGKPSNNRYKEELKQKIKILIEEYYYDFGPTLAAEKLKELHSLKISKESLRKFMIDWDLRQAKAKKPNVIHQQRPRRSCFGELIQIDGSHHAWFEDRGEKCCLIVFIDDATSNIVAMHFAKTEDTQGYFACAKSYIKTCGIPLAIYSDRHCVFKINKPNSEDKETQFGRAMRELGIKLIYAHSPQAKGRIERANRTLQDRLVKELRLNNISTIDEANAFVEKYIFEYNQKFGKKPMAETDRHRKDIPSDEVLTGIFCERHYRKLSKNLEFSFEKNTYQISQPLREGKVIVCRFSNEIKISYQGKYIECKKLQSALPAKDQQPQAKSWEEVPFLRLIQNQAQQMSIAVASPPI